MLHDSFTCAMTDSYAPWLMYTCYDLCICGISHSHVPWLVHMLHDSCIFDGTQSYVPWFIHMCHDSFIRVMTHSYAPWPILMCYDSFTCLIHMCHDTFTCDLFIRAITHSYFDETLVRSTIHLDLVAFFEIDALGNCELGGNHRGSFHFFSRPPPAEQTALNSWIIIIMLCPALPPDMSTYYELSSETARRCTTWIGCASRHTCKWCTARTGARWSRICPTIQT